MSGWSRKPRGLILAALALGALLAGCNRREPQAPGAKILRVSQRNEPATLDPQLASLPDEFMVLRALLEGLAVPTPAGGIQPAVAEKWETSTDGLAWTFHLRRDARWSDGTQVTAADFLFTIRRALTPALAAPKAPLFFVLKNAEAYYRGTLTDFSQVGAAAPDDHTLVLALEAPTPHLPALVASGAWLPAPAATVVKFGDTRSSAWTRPGNFVGNGPYTLSEWREHQHLLVRRNRFYRQFARARLDAIRFQIYDSGDTEERAFRAGQVDITMSVPVGKLGTYAPPTLRTQPLAETRYLAINVQRAPLTDPRVRRALAFAIDRAALAEKILRGGQHPALGFVPPGLGGYPPAELFQPDAGEARRLLAEAGFAGGRGFPKLELTTWTNAPVLEAIQQMWRTGLGIEVSIVQREAKVHIAALASGDFDIGFVPAIPDYGDPVAVLAELLGGAPGNYPHWRNESFDALEAKAARTSEPGQRLALHREAEAVLLAEMPVVPLYFNTMNYLTAPRVRSWRIDPLWTRYYLDVSLED